MTHLHANYANNNQKLYFTIGVAATPSGWTFSVVSL